MPETTTIRQQADDLGDRLNKLTAQYKSGRPTASADYADLKDEALQLASTVEAMDEPEAEDQHAADLALQIAETAKAYSTLTSGRKTRPDALGTGARPSQRTPRGGIRMADFTANEQLGTGGFESMAEFLSAVRDQQLSGRTDERLNSNGPTMLAAGQFGSDDPHGGFLVPDDFQRQLIMSAQTSEPWLQSLNRYIVPDRRGEVVWPQLEDRDRSGEDVGGASLERVSEGGQIQLSTLQFKTRRASLSKAGTRVRVSNELLTDSAVGFEEMIRQVFGQAVALRQALDVVNGSGVGAPTGILKAAGVYEQAKENAQNADTIQYENIIKMFSRISPAVMARSIWLAHPSTFVQLAQLTAADNAHIFVSDVANSAPNSILGRPLYFTEAVPQLGNKGDVQLFDPMAYSYVQKPVRIDLSRDFRFDTDETEFRVVLRDDGAPQHNSTRTDAQGYETSEFVVLAERA